MIVYTLRGAPAFYILSCALAAWVAAEPALASESAASEVRFRLAAVAGATSVGAPAGMEFDRGDAFGSPMLNNDGDLAFIAALRSPTGEDVNGGGIWLDDARGRSLVAGDGSAANGLPAGVSLAPLLDSSSLAASGRVAFRGQLIGPGVTDATDEVVYTGLGTGGGGLLMLVAREGDPAPGAYLGARFRAFGDRVATNAESEVAFTAVIGRVGDDEFGSNNVVLSNADGPLDIVAQSNTAAPDTDPGVSFDRFGEPSLDDAGRTMFAASLLGANVGGDSDTGIWAERNGRVVKIAREGDAAPGVPGALYGPIGKQRLATNADGALAFRSSLLGPDQEVTGHEAVWFRPANGPVTLVARTSQPTPQAGAGTVHRTIGSPTINIQGEIAFDGWVEGPGVTLENDACVWAGRAGALELIAREGSQAPGTDSGIYFTDFADVTISDAGRVAFVGWIDGPGVNPSNDEGIWATDANGDLRLVVRTGYRFDANRDPFIIEWRRAELLWVSGQTREAMYNARGELVFAAQFDDGDAGLVVATLHDGPLCVADITTDSTQNGIPDGAVTLSDFSLFLIRWSNNDPLADLTGAGGCDVAASGDGVRLNDFSCYLSYWAAGCAGASE